MSTFNNSFQDILLPFQSFLTMKGNEMSYVDPGALAIIKPRKRKHQ